MQTYEGKLYLTYILTSYTQTYYQWSVKAEKAICRPTESQKDYFSSNYQRKLLENECMTLKWDRWKHGAQEKLHKDQWSPSVRAEPQA